MTSSVRNLWSDHPREVTFGHWACQVCHVTPFSFTKYLCLSSHCVQENIGLSIVLKRRAWVYVCPLGMLHKRWLLGPQSLAWILHSRPRVLSRLNSGFWERWSSQVQPPGGRAILSAARWTNGQVWELGSFARSSGKVGCLCGRGQEDR